MISRYDWAAICVLWRRDVLKFFKQPLRIVGALGQPILFWLIIGSGMNPTFHIQGDVPYTSYFFPGVITMTLVFASIFASVSLIEDRHRGFLQAVLASPSTRVAVMFGKSAGSATVALLQMALLLILLPAADFAWSEVDIIMLLTVCVLMSLGLSAFGIGLAWVLDNVQAYHAIQMILLVPLWVISGAMFPISDNAPVMGALIRFNPLSYPLAGIRHALASGHATSAITSISPGCALLVTAMFSLACIVIAMLMMRRTGA